MQSVFRQRPLFTRKEFLLQIMPIAGRLDIFFVVRECRRCGFGFADYPSDWTPSTGPFIIILLH